MGKGTFYSDGALDSKTIPFYKRILSEIRLLLSFLKHALASLRISCMWVSGDWEVDD